MYKAIRHAKLVVGGTTIKQGEIFKLGYQLFDAEGGIITPVAGQVISVKIANRTGVVYETTATVVADRIEFTVSENIGFGTMRVELKVSDGVNVLQKYPADGWITLDITASLDDVGVGAVSAVTADQMRYEISSFGVATHLAVDKSEEALTISNNVKSEFDLVVAEAGSNNPEVVQGRGTFSLLKDRLNASDALQASKAQEINDLDNKKSDTAYVDGKLSQKANQSDVRLKTKKIELEDASPTLLAAVEGGEGTSFNLLSIPQDESVTPQKTNFVSRSKNLFNKDTAIQGRLDTVTGAINTSDTGWFTSEYIPIQSGKSYKRSHLAELVQYGANYNWLSSSGANNTAFIGVSSVALVRISVRIAEVNVLQLELGTATTSFESWGLIIPSLNGTISVERTAKINSNKLKIVVPYSDDYPDVIHELLPSEISDLTATRAVISKDFDVSWKHKENGIRMEMKSAILADIRREFSAPKNIVGVQVVGVWVHVENPQNVDYIQLFIGHETTGYQWNRIENKTLKKGWNLIRWKAVSGVIGEWNTFYRFMLRVNTKGMTSVTIGSVFFEQTQKAKLLFVEDGGYKEFLNNGYPDLKARNIPTTWALNPGRLGTTRLISESDVDNLAMDYMSSFSFHSWASEVHATMTREQVADNAIKCLRWLQKKGLKEDYVYRAAITQNDCPNHEILQDIIEAYSSPTGAASTEVFPFHRPYGTPRITLHGTSQSAMDAYFLNMKKTRCLMIGYTHGIGVDSISGTQNTTDMTQAEWNYFLQKIDEAQTEGWLEGVTYEQLRRRYSKPSQGWGIEQLYAK